MLWQRKLTLLVVGLGGLLSPVSVLAQSRSPNILLAIADDWSFGHASAYGCRWVETPAFDRVARNGLLFTRAYTPNAKCAPSRAIILTGRNSWQLEEAGNHMAIFPPKFKSYVEALADEGYFVGSTGKGWAPGIAKDAQGKDRQMVGRPFSKRKTKKRIPGISRNDYAGNFEDFLAVAPADRPWVFWYGSSEPHRGYKYGIGVERGKKLEDIERVPSFWPDNETIRNDMLDYAVEVEHFDHHLGRILAAIEREGQLENTLVVATSDHGMPFPRCKGQAYDYSNHVPLAVMWSEGIEGKGRVVDDYVSFADLAPTFLEVAGVTAEQQGMHPLTGRSLLEIFVVAGQGQIIPERDHVLIGKERHDVGRPNDWGYPIRGIVKDGLLYIHNFETDRWPGGDPETGYLNCDGSPTKTEVLNMRRSGTSELYWRLAFGQRPQEELYDVKADPDCIENLVALKEYATQKLALREQLFAELRGQGDPRMFGKGDVFDGYPYSSKVTENFFERFMSGETIRAGWVNASDFEKK